MASVFSKIVKGEIPSYKVAETESCYAFLDINPLKEGHTLVIPKKEVDYLFDLDEQTYVELQLFARKVAKAVRAAVPCKRVGVAVRYGSASCTHPSGPFRQRGRHGFQEGKTFTERRALRGSGSLHRCGICKALSL